MQSPSFFLFLFSLGLWGGGWGGSIWLFEQPPANVLARRVRRCDLPRGPYADSCDNAAPPAEAYTFAMKCYVGGGEGEEGKTDQSQHASDKDASDR